MGKDGLSLKLNEEGKMSVTETKQVVDITETNEQNYNAVVKK